MSRTDMTKLIELNRQFLQRRRSISSVFTGVIGIGDGFMRELGLWAHTGSKLLGFVEWKPGRPGGYVGASYALTKKAETREW